MLELLHWDHDPVGFVRDSTPMEPSIWPGNRDIGISDDFRANEKYGCMPKGQCCGFLFPVVPLQLLLPLLLYLRAGGWALLHLLLMVFRCLCLLFRLLLLFTCLRLLLHMQHLPSSLLTSC